MLNASTLPAGDRQGPEKTHMPPFRPCGVPSGGGPVPTENLHMSIRIFLGVMVVQLIVWWIVSSSLVRTHVRTAVKDGMLEIFQAQHRHRAHFGHYSPSKNQNFFS